jgi:hypothetical protein
MNPSQTLPIRPRFTPELDPAFVPASLWNRAFRALARAEGAVPMNLALERADGSVSRFDTFVLPESSAHFHLTSATSSAS